MHSAYQAGVSPRLKGSTRRGADSRAKNTFAPLIRKKQRGDRSPLRPKHAVPQLKTARSAHCCVSWKITLIFISTEIGVPFKYVGSYFQRETASIAAW